jgi:hypothetical protein
MSHLSIDAEGLIVALEYHGEGEWFLDLQTGEVVFIAGNVYSDPDDELEAQMEAEPERFHPIDPLPSSTGWEVMAEFVEQMPAGEARAALTRALRHSHPFRSFKNALLDYPKSREQWFAFQRKSLAQLAREWLHDESIEAELKLSVAGDE